MIIEHEIQPIRVAIEQTGTLACGMWIIKGEKGMQRKKIEITPYAKRARARARAGGKYRVYKRRAACIVITRRARDTRHRPLLDGAIGAATRDIRYQGYAARGCESIIVEWERARKAFGGPLSFR
ncbi:hypothetical protein EVAR_75382_1 [Eumeta japonica]|uniref:Uncharacterized protein n=1 Tax=Eumeta variegata TaxID=151549 RepID=A0A4C1TL56_EUMVA|nr:hypothetical protein EVAR_75382_1 [Eumeta japonica]